MEYYVKIIDSRNNIRKLLKSEIAFSQESLNSEKRPL